MSTVHLIVGRAEDATNMATSSLEKWPNLAIDPVCNVALAKLFVILTGTEYQTIIDSFQQETPDQPDVEPWDLENLIFPVDSIPEQYVRALANMRDENLSEIADKWRRIEELAWYKLDLSDVKDQLVAFRELAAQCIAQGESLLIYLAP
jgi:hypothetical protein